MRLVLDTNDLSPETTGVTHDVIVRDVRGDSEIIVTVTTLTEFRETVKKYAENLHID